MRSLLFFVVYYQKPYILETKNRGRIYGNRNKQSNRNDNEYGKNRNRNGCCNNCDNICGAGSNDGGKNCKRNKNQESRIQKDKC